METSKKRKAGVNYIYIYGTGKIKLNATLQLICYSDFHVLPIVSHKSCIFYLTSVTNT